MRQGASILVFINGYDLYMYRHGLYQMPNETSAVSTLLFRKALKTEKNSFYFLWLPDDHSVDLVQHCWYSQE